MYTLQNKQVYRQAPRLQLQTVTAVAQLKHVQIVITLGFGLDC